MYIPDNPSDVKLHVKDMATMTMFKFANNLAAIQIPHFDTPVVTRAYQTASVGVKGQSTDKHAVARKRLQAFTR